MIFNITYSIWIDVIVIISFAFGGERGTYTYSSREYLTYHAIMHLYFGCRVVVPNIFTTEDL